MVRMPKRPNIVGEHFNTRQIRPKHYFVLLKRENSAIKNPIRGEMIPHFLEAPSGPLGAGTGKFF